MANNEQWGEENLRPLWEDSDEKRMDIIGQNGFHFDQLKVIIMEDKMKNKMEPDMNRFDGKELGNLWLAKHGHRTKEATSPTYTTWSAMRKRCSDKSNPNYGGSGIEVCERWLSFEDFFIDMGERPEGCTIDRINPDKGYFPDNCRWATSKEQARNRRTTILTEINGDKLMLSEVSRVYGVPMTTIFRRYKQGLRGSDLICKINRNSFRVGSRCATSKLKEPQVAEIKKLLSEGIRASKIAKDFNVSQSAISEIKSGKTWGHIKI